MAEEQAQQFRGLVVESRRVTASVHEVRFAAHPAMSHVQPGQFVFVTVRDGLDPLLPRPMSVCRRAEDGTWSMLFRVAGTGTQLLAAAPVGSHLDILGPLGRGFSLPSSAGRVLLVGGGLGVAPLVLLAQALCQQGRRPIPVLGFATASEAICIDFLAELGLEPMVATDDGTLGRQGLVTDLLEGMGRPDIVYTCGPRPMMKAVARWCLEQEIKCQASLEERMACGVGACLSCVCAVDRTGQGKWGWERVCKEGPVFDAEVLVDVAP